ncbi:hypothetical protein NQ315_006638 [Exocentrus adspersus]|uniref:SDE2-like domain-containing protein n=1 Tax=Exocentrus adspersus TaxID=1586481 RepID=A0AAV8VFE6_9CUCU|nr:hypothetical protein NQ315_006638 [Exocentrus adspersus]
MEVLINGKSWFTINVNTNLTELICFLGKLGLTSEEYYLISNGKLVNDNIPQCTNIHVIPRLSGGKGGFGSMLRAIGAQIEKTTNREACRDLSGRRLRDINEEQRLKNWINQQAEREKEVKERKQKKLERLCEMPKHEFKDAHYDKERSELPEIVEDAVTRGLQASCSMKRKATDKKPIARKKAKLWVDDELDDNLSSSADEGTEDSDQEESKSSVGSLNSENSNAEKSVKIEHHCKTDETNLDSQNSSVKCKCVDVENDVEVENGSEQDTRKIKKDEKLKLMGKEPNEITKGGHFEENKGANDKEH